MKKLAVIFPGIGYHADKPLLYYAKEIARYDGYEIIDVNYRGFPEKVKGDIARMRESFDLALSQAENILESVDFESVDELLFIGKSVGTAVAGCYAAKHNLKPRYVIYTPVEMTFEYKYEDAIVFNGTHDSWTNSQAIRSLCEEQNIPVYITPFANHSLEVEEKEMLGKSDTTLDELNLKNMAVIMQHTREFILKSKNPNLEQNLNPYMASWEYTPDGEPYLFGDRVYVYGSHDMFGGDVYCMLDYVCWSAPVSDLGNWRYEGVIYRIGQDPDNVAETGKLYAPDVAKGPDGRYYLYYAVNNTNHISVAVCDFPAGEYEFYGYVQYRDGVRLGDKESDEMQFDPGVLREDGKTYLYTGFCPVGQQDRHGAMMTVLDSDMITILEAPRFVVPSEPHSKGTGFEGHEFFEAPSIRKVGDKYTFIYSSIMFHELCYAQADSPAGPFTYKGVVISNGDLGIDTYKDAKKCTYYCANNHGSIEKIGDDWYVFYHRHTNGNNYCRQACFEKLSVNDDCTINQAHMTSCNSLKPLKAEGVYPTYIACNLFNDIDMTYVPWQGWMDDVFPKITQDGADGQMKSAYVTNMRDKATAGFKSFDFCGVKKIGLSTKGYGTGVMEIRLTPNGSVVGIVDVTSESVWTYRESPADIADGVHDLYITYRGEGWSSIKEITFVK